jgi:hypothetical protein
MATTLIEALVPSVHDTLTLREALSKLARKLDQPSIFFSIAK